MFDLQEKEKEILDYLDSHSGTLSYGEFCKVSRNKLAKELHRTPTSIWRTLRRLRRQKRIKTIYNYRTKENIYEL